MSESSICGGCGAKLPPDADLCDLCGWSVTDEAAAAEPGAGINSASDTLDGEHVEGRHDAGPSRVADAGAVHAAVKPEESEAAGPSDNAARSAFLVAAAATLLVAGLYLITVVSRSATSTTTPPTVQPVDTSPAPLTGEAKGEEEALRAQIDDTEGSGRVDLQRALIALYVRENRLDLAGEVQEDIAADLDSELEWVRTGNLYYDWMELQGGALRTAYARKAVGSYQRALEINPDNLDARTDMALAYFYDPQQPMEAIKNITMVLEADSTHIQANYNRGYLLFQIGRYDQSVAQFEKVMRLVGNPEDPIYRRAQAAIQTVRQRAAAS